LRVERTLRVGGLGVASAEPGSGVLAGYATLDAPILPSVLLFGGASRSSELSVVSSDSGEGGVLDRGEF